MSTPVEMPDWLDHDALDICIAQWIDGQEDPDLRTAMIAAVERADAELVFHEDERGEWVGVRVMGQRLGRAHRSRVQKAGAN